MSFTGGDKLKAKLGEIARQVARADTVNVGFLSDATYPDGTPVAAIAVIQEYGGTANVPEHDVTINRNINAAGEFKNGGKFVKAGKANYQTTHHVDAYTITIPARPFFRGMIATNKGEWGPKLGKIIKAADYDSTVALGRLGELVQGQLIQSIRDFSDPENAKSTVAKKGFDDPLIGSGHMANSTGYEVNEP
jgi:hypothetical protein